MRYFPGPDSLWLTPGPPVSVALPLATGGVRLKKGAAEPLPPVRRNMPVSIFAQEHLGFQPDPIQARILDTATHRLIVCCTRQWGKSTIAAVKAVHLACTRPGSLILFASASLPQAAEMLRIFRGFVHRFTGHTYRGDGIHRESIVLPNGSRVVALPHSPDTVRGFSGTTLLVVDEAAFVTDRMHAAVSPFLAASNGQQWLLSSPNGQSGEFYKIWSARLPGWNRFRVTAGECPRISREFLDAERLTKGEAAFRREFFCEFTAGPKQVIDRQLVDQAFKTTYNAVNLNL